VFSGTVATESTCSRTAATVTEQSLNSKHATLATSDIVIVCDKLDTGYSDPLLARMYIDRYLRSSVQAVQLLSRLNRTHPKKPTVRVVDFANHPAQIRRHFGMFWQVAKTEPGETSKILADLRTAIVIVCDALSPWEIDLSKQEQLQQRVDLLIRSADRDVFHQFLDAARLGLVAWDAIAQSEYRRTLEAFSPLRCVCAICYCQFNLREPHPELCPVGGSISAH
jgi:hypothetical protein